MTTNEGFDIQKLRTTIGETARQARHRAMLTQADVADMLGMATEVYGRLERGHLLPSVPSLFRLCLALKVSSDHILGIDDSRMPDLADPPAEPHESPQLRRLLRTLRQLTPEQLKVLVQVAHLIQKNP